MVVWYEKFNVPEKIFILGSTVVISVSCICWDRSSKRGTNVSESI